MAIRRVLMILLAAAAACEPAPNRLPPVRAADTVEREPLPQVTARSRYFIAQPLYELVDSADRAERYREQAIGVVVPAYGEDAPQELSVVNDTAYEIQTVARLRFYPRPEGGWSDTLWTREAGLYGGLIRATHDDYGLPVVSKHGRWLRVYYAFAADGSPRSGWVLLVPNKSVYHDRDRQLFEYNSTLANPAETEFFDRTRSRRVDVAIGAGHTLQVLEVDGDWVRVVLMQPDTSACTGDERARVTRRDTVWLRKLNAQGKRQLSTAVAGC